MGFDPWADKLVKSAGEKVTVIDASEGIIPIEDQDDHGEHHEKPEQEEPGTETGHEEGHRHHHHEFGNPHYWGNPENVKIMAGNILEGLCQELPEKEAYFKHNYQAYLLKIDRTVGELKTKLETIATKQIVSYSAAFPYLYQYFGLENLETVENACEQEVSPKRLAEVITDMKANRVKVIVGEAVYPKLPENLTKDTGAKLVLLWPATNETGDYLETLKENIEKLVSELE
jgi:ABC-type Zn uptake system ZnuABC Zn-binding protein ZnuA